MPAMQHPSSYRDPSGFIFEKDGDIYRQVNKCYQENFDQFIQSGCYKHLTDNNWLISHEVVPANLTGDPNCYTTLKPEKVPFISYPYEWSFEMLKDAALLTLKLLKEALGYGFVLKDATPYNVQWHKGQFIFIDTLSFEKFDEKPWIAYRQFCETFLGPLLLMHYNKQSLPNLQLAWPEGIPLSVTSSMLPWKTKFSIHTYLHIHLHAKIAAGKGASNIQIQEKKDFGRSKLLNLINSLDQLIKKLTLPEVHSTWSDYYDEAVLRDDYLEQKKIVINSFLDKLPHLKKAADLGANEGEFSSLLAARNIETLAADFDPYCIDNLYRKIKKNGTTTILPLVIDLANPSPAIGVNNKERAAFLQRLQPDLVMSLAVIHHLAIGKNIPLVTIAELFATVSPYLIIEFVPKEDAKVQLMLSQKKDIYADYTEENFNSSFSVHFTCIEKKIIPGSLRTLYLFKHN
jgi:2-polyprenyl-3-methyl-5-hydroxy-6-metoxy-1,4-benzoquinol methylase